MDKNTAAVILSGGKSERMKHPKPFLRFNEKYTFIEKIVDEYAKFGCKEITIVMADTLMSSAWKKTLKNLSDKALIVPNKHPESGRFYSLQLGINKLKQVHYCFMQNIDNPFVDTALLTSIYQARGEKGFVKPVYQGKGGHPVLLSTDIIQYIKAQKDYDINIKAILNQFDKTEIAAGKNILININTHSEYRQYFENNEI